MAGGKCPPGVIPNLLQRHTTQLTNANLLSPQRFLTDIDTTTHKSIKMFPANVPSHAKNYLKEVLEVEVILIISSVEYMLFDKIGHCDL